jgi:hypothetical protein
MNCRTLSLSALARLQEWHTGLVCSLFSFYLRIFPLTRAVPFPLDTIKSVIQNSERRLRIVDVYRDIVQRQGFRGLYKGCLVTVLRSAPSSAIAFLAYEHFASLFNVQTT